MLNNLFEKKIDYLFHVNSFKIINHSLPLFPYFLLDGAVVIVLFIWI